MEKKLCHAEENKVDTGDFVLTWLPCKFDLQVRELLSYNYCHHRQHSTSRRWNWITPNKMVYERTHLTLWSRLSYVIDLEPVSVEFRCRVTPHWRNQIFRKFLQKKNWSRAGWISSDSCPFLDSNLDCIFTVCVHRGVGIPGPKSFPGRWVSLFPGPFWGGEYPVVGGYVQGVNTQGVSTHGVSTREVSVQGWVPGECISTQLVSIPGVGTHPTTHI